MGVKTGVSHSNQVDLRGYVLRIAMQLKQSCKLNQRSDTSDCLKRVV